jgi:hypothetical protein
MKPWVYTEQDAEALDIDQFLDRIGKREDADIKPPSRTRGPYSPRSARRSALRP